MERWKSIPNYETGDELAKFGSMPEVSRNFGHSVSAISKAIRHNNVKNNSMNV